MTGDETHFGATAGPADAAHYQATLEEANIAWKGERPDHRERPAWADHSRRSSMDSLSSSGISPLNTRTPHGRNRSESAVSSPDSWDSSRRASDYTMTPEEEEEGPVIIPGYTSDPQDEFQTTRASMRTLPDKYRAAMEKAKSKSKSKLKAPPVPMKDGLDEVREPPKAKEARADRKDGRRLSSITQLPSPATKSPPIVFRDPFHDANAMERGAVDIQYSEQPQKGLYEGPFVQRNISKAKQLWFSTAEQQQKQIRLKAFLLSRKDFKFWAPLGLFVILFIIFFFLAVTR